MHICAECGETAQPDQLTCAQCGAALSSVPPAAEVTPPVASAESPAQRYLPAQPYVPPGQLYDGAYRHPYVSDQTDYVVAGEGDVPPADEEPTVVVGALADVSDPALFIPADLAQQAYWRYLPRYATNPIAGALVGGVGAFLMVIGMTLAFLGVAGGAVGAVLFAPLSTLPITTPVPMQPVATAGFFAVIGLAHHAHFTLQTSTGLYTLTYPVTTLLALPALGLTLGGYIAAATDYSRRWQLLVARAAAIAPVYASLLLVSSAIFGTTTLHSVAGQRGAASLSVAGSSLLLQGLLWGVVFGSLGGVIRLFGWRWRAALVALLLGKPRNPILAGAVGAFAAVSAGLLLTFVFGIFIFATGGASSQLLATLGHVNPWQNATPGYVAVLSASVSVWLLIFGAGGVFTTTSASVNALPTNATISIFDSRVPLPYLLLIVVPPLVYFGGGYLAARLTRSPSQQIHLIAGAFVGIFGGVITLMLANVTGYALTLDTLTNFGGRSSTGPDPSSAFLGALIVGTLCGLLGAFAFQPRRQPMRPPRSYLLEPLLALYDRLTLQPIGVARPRARALLYLTITVALLFAVGGGAVELASGILARVVAAPALYTAVTLYGGLMLAVPVIVFFVAFVVDLLALPQGTEVVVQDALPPPPASLAPPSSPYEYPIHPLTLPEMPQISPAVAVPVLVPPVAAPATREGIAPR